MKYWMLFLIAISLGMQVQAKSITVKLSDDSGFSSSHPPFIECRFYTEKDMHSTHEAKRPDFNVAVEVDEKYNYLEIMVVQRISTGNNVEFRSSNDYREHYYGNAECDPFGHSRRIDRSDDKLLEIKDGAAYLVKKGNVDCGDGELIVNIEESTP